MCITSMMRTIQERNHPSRFLHKVSGGATCDQMSKAALRSSNTRKALFLPSIITNRSFGSQKEFSVEESLDRFVANVSVRVGSTPSELHEQEMGVLQGSILSPAVFSIKINKLLTLLRRVRTAPCFCTILLCVCVASKIGCVRTVSSSPLQRRCASTSTRSMNFPPTRTTFWERRL